MSTFQYDFVSCRIPHGGHHGLRLRNEYIAFLEPLPASFKGEHPEIAEGAKISPDLLSPMSMDLLSSATEPGCHCSYKARQGKNEMPSHLHRSRRREARIYAGGIATSMLPGRNQIDGRCYDDVSDVQCYCAFYVKLSERRKPLVVHL